MSQAVQKQVRLHPSLATFPFRAGPSPSPRAACCSEFRVAELPAESVPRKNPDPEPPAGKPVVGPACGDGAGGREQVHMFKPQELASSLWGLARLRHHPGHQLASTALSETCRCPRPPCSVHSPGSTQAACTAASSSLHHPPYMLLYLILLSWRTGCLARRHGCSHDVLVLAMLRPSAPFCAPVAVLPVLMPTACNSRGGSGRRGGCGVQAGGKVQAAGPGDGAARSGGAGLHRGGGGGRDGDPAGQRARLHAGRLGSR